MRDILRPVELPLGSKATIVTVESLNQYSLAQAAHPANHGTTAMLKEPDLLETAVLACIIIAGVLAIAAWFFL
jgi:hypothetical protein